jgi:hypothetical protein
MPAERAGIELSVRFTSQQFESIARGHVPEQMEDKWFVWMGDDLVLHAHRSWSGFCIFEAQFARAGGDYRVVGAWANADPEQSAIPPEMHCPVLKGLLEALAGRPSS